MFGNGTQDYNDSHEDRQRQQTSALKARIKELENELTWTRKHIWPHAFTCFCATCEKIRLASETGINGLR